MKMAISSLGIEGKDVILLERPWDKERATHVGRESVPSLAHIVAVTDSNM